MPRTAKSARTLGNRRKHAGIGKKIQPDEWLDLGFGGAGGIKVSPQNLHCTQYFSYKSMTCKSGLRIYKFYTTRVSPQSGTLIVCPTPQIQAPAGQFPRMSSSANCGRRFNSAIHNHGDFLLLWQSFCRVAPNRQILVAPLPSTWKLPMNRIRRVSPSAASTYKAKN